MRRRAAAIRAAGAAAPAAQPGADPRLPSARRELPQVACFDTAFHRTTRSWRRPSRCRSQLTTPACAATAFTACPTSTSPRCCRDSMPRRPQRPHGRAAPGQRRQHVRAAGRPQRRQHDGLHRGGRPADGHALRRHRPRRHPLPDGRAQMDARAIEQLIYQDPGLLGVSGVSSDMRTLLASDEPRRQAGDRPVRLPHRPRAGLAGRRAGRAGCHRLHRRHRRTRRAGPRARCAAPRPGSAWNWTPRPMPAAARASAAAAAAPAAWVIPTNEELMIARHTRHLLSPP